MKKQTPFLPILILAAVGLTLPPPAFALRKQQAKNSPSATAGLEEFLKNPVENALAAAGLTSASPATAGLEEAWLGKTDDVVVGLPYDVTIQTVVLPGRELSREKGELRQLPDLRRTAQELQVNGYVEVRVIEGRATLSRPTDWTLPRRLPIEEVANELVYNQAVQNAVYTRSPSDQPITLSRTGPEFYRQVAQAARAVSQGASRISVQIIGDQVSLKPIPTTGLEEKYYPHFEESHVFRMGKDSLPGIVLVGSEDAIFLVNIPSLRPQALIQPDLSQKTLRVLSSDDFVSNHDLEDSFTLRSKFSNPRQKGETIDLGQGISVSLNLEKRQLEFDWVSPTPRNAPEWFAVGLYRPVPEKEVQIGKTRLKTSQAKAVLIDLIQNDPHPEDLFLASESDRGGRHGSASVKTLSNRGGRSFTVKKVVNAFLRSASFDLKPPLRFTIYQRGERGRRIVVKVSSSVGLEEKDDDINFRKGVPNGRVVSELGVYPSADFDRTIRPKEALIVAVGSYNLSWTPGAPLNLQFVEWAPIKEFGLTLTKVLETASTFRRLLSALPGVRRKENPVETHARLVEYQESPDSPKKLMVVFVTSYPAAGLEERTAVEEQPVPAAETNRLASVAVENKVLILGPKAIGVLQAASHLVPTDVSAIPVVVVVENARQAEQVKAWALDLPLLSVTVVNASLPPYNGSVETALEMTFRYYASEKGMSPIVARTLEDLPEIAAFLGVPEAEGFLREEALKAQQDLESRNL